MHEESIVSSFAMREYFQLQINESFSRHRAQLMEDAQECIPWAEKADVESFVDNVIFRRLRSMYEEGKIPRHGLVPICNELRVRVNLVFLAAKHEVESLFIAMQKQQSDERE